MSQRISIQGFRGSYHDIAAHKYFGEDISLIEREQFKEVFADVSEDRADYGVIAVENSIAGSILENYDLLLHTEVHIIGEVYLRIAHQLMALPGTELGDIQEVLSHPMAIKQCREFLDKHPDWEIVEESDTAGSAAKIRKERREHSAAIASKAAAELYEMDILAEDIESNKKNYTRFLLISSKPDYPADASKSSIAFTTPNVAGALADVLDRFARLGINLAKIESRPIIGAVWSYTFYIDFEAGIQTEKSQALLKELHPITEWYKVLGSYQQGRMEDVES